ncbi:dockerin type I repeat-containing protein [Ruminococcus sp.]|uniref:dockerin type I repeat-containing protein n=1 Tax=Ruminococcus sp. TaxID=41978 RepID=UPI002E8169DF|nr:dockerin type I domain-containing protein [Ruminococcus sp.]MEE3491976.1 dockerin type I domain-containing protein [Ruminococcus sp.]
MKKVISLFLVAALLTAALAVSFNALSVSDVEDGVPVVQSVSEGIAAYEAENEMEPGSLKTQRIYFMMPNGKNGPVATDDVYVHYDDELDPDTGEVITPAHDDLVLRKGDKSPTWYNDFNILDGKHYAGVYWWGGPAEKDGYWVGYRMEIENYEQGIYYADIPYDIDDTSASVAVAIFNNGVDGGTDSSLPIYYKAAQTIDTNIEGAFVGDYDSLEYGSPDPWCFNNCIYVIDPDQFSINAFSQKQTCGANWYVYYGNGCYGKEYQEGVGEDSEYPDGTPGWSDNVADICMNPDHFKDGVHVGYQPPVDDPTQAPTEAPTQGPTQHVHNPAAPVAENVVPATCTAAGSYDEVVYCLDCHEEISRTHKTIEMIAHNLTYVPVVPATEEAEGIKAHYECEECHKLFADATGTTEVTVSELVIPKLDHQHTLKFKPGKKATTTADGWKSYFYCTECGKYFNNAAGEIELTWDQIVIPKIVPTEPPTEAPKPTQAPTDPPKPTQAPPTQAPPTEPAELLGDVDGDGTVTINDAVLIQRADVGIITATADMTRRGDVDGDGQLTIFDATFIQRFLADIPVSYKINQPILSSTPH